MFSCEDIIKMFFKECLFLLNYRTIYSFEKQDDINKFIYKECQKSKYQ